MGKISSQRANVKNPNNIAFKSAADNRSIQLNMGHKTITISKQQTVNNKKTTK